MPEVADAVFVGRIAGFGTAAGTRIVVGDWRTSPFGAFADVMVEHADGTRVLIAPTDEVAHYVSTTYAFEQVLTEPVRLSRTPSLVEVEAGPLRATFEIGGRRPLGWLLRLVPRRLAIDPRWLRAIDPIARRLVRGVQVRGSAGRGRTEYYGATDLHEISGVRASWDDVNLGALRPVEPAPRFGFSSTPPEPCIVDVVTTIREGER